MFTFIFAFALGYGVRYAQIRFADGFKATKNRIEAEIDKNLKG